MKYLDPNKQPIESFEGWEKQIFTSSKKSKHWKKGRSAYSIADFMMNKDGEAVLKRIVTEILGDEIQFDTAIPEFEVRFDKFGHGREHDLGVFGRNSEGELVFIGVEAKVDESFNETVLDSYVKAKSKKISGKSTNQDIRIEQLLKKHFGKVKPAMFDLRYQLLYSTVGTLEAKLEEEKADHAIMLVIVFKTSDYNEVKGLENYRDYIQFVELMGSKKISNNQDLDVRELNIDGNILHSVYMNITVEE